MLVEDYRNGDPIQKRCSNYKGGSDSTGIICVYCGKEILVESKRMRKYCSDRCSIASYHERNGSKINLKKCACGCGGYIASRKQIPENKIFKRNHDRVPDPNLKRCHLCNDRTFEVFRLSPTFNHDVCGRCLDNVNNS